MKALKVNEKLLDYDRLGNSKSINQLVATYTKNNQTVEQKNSFSPDKSPILKRNREVEREL